MAKNFMSSVLDELMGRNRDALPTEAPKQLEWDDPEVCPYYLVCFCPHELFVNTKADLGSCIKFHDDQLRQKYVEEAPNYKKAQHEAEFIRFAEKMIADIEGKIKRGKMRIALANGPDGGTYAGPGSKNAERIALLTERINSLLEEAESAGCVGDVEKAQGLMKLCDQIKEERDQLKSNEVSHPWNPDKAMQVCEVCGSYLIIGEAQHRLDDHIMGKQHVGFAMLRKNLDDVRKAQEKRDEEERERMEKEREKRWIDRTTTVVKKDEDKEKDRDSRRGEDRHRRDRDRDRDRGHDRDRKRHRSRSRDKGKDKDAEKAKDKDSEKGNDTDKPKEVDKTKDKERSERRRSRSRDKGKSRDRDRRRDSPRDRNKDRDRRSRRHDDDKKRSRRSRSRSNSKRTSKDKDRDRDRSDRGRKRSGSRHRDRKEKDKERGSSRSSSQRHTRDKEDIEKEKITTEKIVDEDAGPSAAKSPKLDVPVPEEERKVEMEVDSSGLDDQVQNGNAVPEDEEPKTESPANEDSVTTD